MIWRCSLRDHAWVMGFPGSVTVCDREGVIVEMNDKAAANYAKYGGRELIGTNLLNHHSDESRQKLQKILDQKQPNIYTIEKNGIKKLIYQSPWYEDGEFAGLVELSLEIPFEMPHYVRSS